MLIFATPNDYQNLLDSLADRGYEYFVHWDQLIKFKSLRSFYDQDDDLDKLPIDDELLAVVLNPEFKIQIGEFGIQLNTENREIIAQQLDSNFKLVNSKIFSFDAASLTLEF